MSYVRKNVFLYEKKCLFVREKCIFVREKCIFVREKELFLRRKCTSTKKSVSEQVLEWQASTVTNTSTEIK